MRVLLANDDGINAPGISALARRFSREHEVYIVAPDTNRSAASCSMTVARPMKIVKIDSENLPSVAAFSLAGSPVDCALCGIAGPHVPDVDVVVSGINDGPNVGTDIIYSGTCGAARHASLSPNAVDKPDFRPEHWSPSLFWARPAAGHTSNWWFLSDFSPSTGTNPPCAPRH